MAYISKRNLKTLRDMAIMSKVKSHNGVILIRTTIGVCQKCNGPISLYADYKKSTHGQFDIECPECGQEYFLSPEV